MPLFAADLERLHGAELARPPLSEARSPYLLYKMLQERRPRIDTTKQAVKTWFGQYRRDVAGERVHSTEELERVYGDCIRDCQLAHAHPTAFLLCKALRNFEPPVLVSDAIARRWLREHGGINIQSQADNAAHLELRWGARIREHLAGAAMEAAALAKWMLTIARGSVPTRVCETWLKRDWAPSGALMVSGGVESAVGDKPCLDGYKECFVDEVMIENVVFLFECSVYSRLPTAY